MTPLGRFLWAAYRSGWHITFVRNAAGNVTGAEATNGRVRRVRFERQR